MNAPANFTPDLATIRQFASKNASTYLGIEITRYDADGMVLTMPISEKTRQPLGLFHGGMSLVLAESAASMHACWGLDLTKFMPVGIEINGSHLSAARDGNVRATTRVLRRGRSIIVHEVEIHHVETGALMCVSRVTNFFKPIAPQS
jgi:1,4-dihydroxy-2-naphthoyl-CoA hydrolase